MNEVRIVPTHLALQQIPLFLILCSYEDGPLDCE